MRKAAGLVLIICVFFSQLTLSQGKNSIQLNGGITSATNSSNGVTGTLQYNYHLNSNFSFFAYSGLLSWDRNNVSYYKGQSTAQNLENTYSEDSHRMVPVYIGAKYYFNNSSAFRPFVSLETGISFLSYNLYDLQQVKTQDGYTLLVPANKNKQNETMFGVGLGIGATHDIGESLQILLEARLNTVKNSKYDWFSSGGTIRTFQVGLGYKL